MIFSPARTRSWLNRYLKEGFAHVRVVLHKPGCFVWVDPRIAYTEINVYPDTYKIVKSEDETHIAYSVMIDVTKDRGIVRPFTCVEQVKAILGISKWWILTPHQLYKELKNGRYVQKA